MEANEPGTIHGRAARKFSHQMEIGDGVILQAWQSHAR